MRMQGSEAEREVWDLLTRDVTWVAPPGARVKVVGGGSGAAGDRVQLFELVVTAVMDKVRPEFTWSVTPNSHDAGLDFKGEQPFLDDDLLGIDAAITVGGQCKKRSRVRTVLDEIGGSVLTMTDEHDPTFVVVALSARLSRSRVEKARATLERRCQRHCHILDRAQIEGLFADHLDTVVAFLRPGLDEAEVGHVAAYLLSLRTERPTEVTVVAPDRVLAGEPFHVEVDVRSTLVTHTDARLWWRPADEAREGDKGGDDGDVSGIGPVGVDSHHGIALAASNDLHDPLRVRRRIELVTHAVGDVDLGEVEIGVLGTTTVRRAIGRVQVVDNIRPRFFDRPLRAATTRLTQQFDRASTGTLAVVGVVGAGGSGKSRLCEEFARERWRRGAGVVTARQAKAHDVPLGILTSLLVALAGDVAVPDAADRVVRALSGFDSGLAASASSAIRAAFGHRDGADAPGDADEAALLSALVVLVAARSQDRTLVVHLQDLHWCGAEALDLLDRLLWRLAEVLPGAGRSRGVLVLLEGRVREADDRGSWSSEPFEELLRRGGHDVVICAPYGADDSREFVQRLFEARHAAHRVMSGDLLALQDELVERICRVAGTNPFHVLEQVQMLKERRVLAQNRATGLLVLVQPDATGTALPASVFASIEARWRYLRRHDPDLSLLVWACALLEDRVPVKLFDRLRARLAPEASLSDVDGTDMLWTGDGRQAEVVFRHEHYFEALRRFDVGDADRDRVVAAYGDWFDDMARPGPSERFRWARALLSASVPDVDRARTLLTSARTTARRRGDLHLARRATAALLDLTWETDDRDALARSRLWRAFDDEVTLSRELLGSDRASAAVRIGALRSRLERHLSTTADERFAARLRSRQIAADLVHAELLFNDRRPDRAAALAESVVAELGRGADLDLTHEQMRDLEMEALHVLACGRALAGEVQAAVPLSARAADIARASTSPLAINVISTYGNILIVVDPRRGEAVLRELLDDPRVEGTDRHLVEVHLSMCLVLQAHQARAGTGLRSDALGEARERLDRVFRVCYRLGLHPDAAAAALMRGIVAALEDQPDEVAWFAHAVATAARGRQMETLWRAHVNLASAVFRRDGHVSPVVIDHARAALEIISDSLSSYAVPETSPRFELVRVPVEMAVRYLVLGGDDAGYAALDTYPVIGDAVMDRSGTLSGRTTDGDPYYEWLAVDDVHYVLY